MKKNIHFIIILVLLATFGCKKKKYPEPETTDESPFYVKAQVDGQPLELKAGSDNYYMFSSFSLDSSNVYNLIGEFKQGNCSSCPNSVRFQINDSKNSQSGSTIDINSVLQVKDYHFLTGNKELIYSVNFYGYSLKPGSYAWDFGDGTTSTEASPQHTFTSGTYSVTLVTTADDGCKSTLSNVISLASANDLNVSVVASSVGNSLSFNPSIYGGTGPFTYFWEFGDGATSTNAHADHQYPFKGVYHARLTITDSQGKTTSCNYNAVAGSDSTFCAANFSFPGVVYTGKRAGLSKVSVKYTDANGVVYTSDNSSQPQSSGFQVVSIEDYLSDINNKSIKKVKLKFNCTVYNGTRSVSIQNGEVLVGLSYN